MQRLRRNKKGDITDSIMFLIIIFFVAVSLVITLFVNGIIQEIIQTTALNESTTFANIDSSFSTIQEYTVQRGFLLFYGILVIGIIVSSFLIRVHPVFIFIYIIILGVAIFTSIYLANTYALMVENPQFAAMATDYTMITWVMQNIVMITLAVGALSMIIIFGKIFGGARGGEL